MPKTTSRRLPRGRSALPRAEVERIQRARLASAMTEVMAEKGYAATSVGDVLGRSGVSRQSFYQVFDSKLDCFMAAFDMAGDVLVGRLLEMLGDDAGKIPGPGSSGDPLEGFEAGFRMYLEALAMELPYTRLFLIEVYAAGDEAIRRRGELQEVFVAGLADLMGVTGEQGRFTCRLLVAAISALVTGAVARNDAEALRAVGPPLIAHVRTLWEAGAFR